MSIVSRVLERAFQLPPAETHDIVVERDIKVRMPDGVDLLTDRYYPRGNPRAPVLLVRSVYGKGGFFGALFGVLLSERGFQVVVQSCRGVFGSGGELVPFFSEHTDGLATVEWIKQEQWFSGVLGLAGGSYLGYTAWAIAADAAKDIGAMCLTATASQFRGQTYPGDSFSLADPLGWTYQVSVQEEKPARMLLMMLGLSAMKRAFWHLPLGKVDELLLGRKVKFWQDWLENSEPDFDWWKPADFSGSVRQVSFPVSLVTGWYDIFLPWLMVDYMALRSAGHRPYLCIGPWSHASQKMNGYGIAESVAWFRAHLYEKPGSVRPLPVHLFIMGLDQWKDFEEWPPQGYMGESWYLQPGRRLAAETPAASEPDLYTYDPADPTPSVGGVRIFGKPGPQDNRKLEARADVLTYTSDILLHDTELVGPVWADLYVRSNRPHADFFVRLCDVHPSGRSRNVCDGIRRLRPGNPPAELDGCVKARIEMWPTAYLFKRGHRIRVQVSSGAFPRIARNPGTGEPLATATTLLKAEQNVYHDPEHPSAIVLPVKRHP